MVQATDFTDGHDFAEFRWLDRPAVRCILGESEVGPGVMVVPEIRSQDVSQVALAQDDDVVETVAPNGADQAFQWRRRLNLRASGAAHWIQGRYGRNP
jgi:hypothetical protein